GPELPIPDDARRVDAAGAWALPGIIDAHSHIGTLEDGAGWAGDDHDEGTDPVTARIRAIDALNPADLALRDAVAAGVLAVGVNPGSCNVVGGQCVALRVWAGPDATVDELVLRNPCGIKSALGENPKKAYGDRRQFPSTRMGVAALLRQTLTRAQRYEADRHETQRYEAQRDGARSGPAQHDGAGAPSATDLDLAAIGLALRGEVPWRQHVHRADDIATALRLADEFGYRLVIDHGTESAPLAAELARRGIPVVVGPLIVTRCKDELRHKSPRTAGALAAAGVKIAIATDHPVVPVQFLTYQATLAVRDGLDPRVALEALTINPAEILGVDDRLGSLEPGKDADFCLWSGDPLDPMQRVLASFIRGRRVYHWDDARGVGFLDGQEWSL
ncbi:MAG: amidohydrolase, partial [Actinomycetia bacterium]|nr:amidohydrolase [Actinomycetes bacterium]